MARMGADEPRSAVFAYGSLVSARSVSQMLGREFTRFGPVCLEGWRRRWSLKRDNPGCEKTFARRDSNHVPAWILSLNLEPASESPDREPSAIPNGVLLPVSEEDLARFDAREMRYGRVEVTEQLRASDGSDVAGPRGDELAPLSAAQFESVFTYTAKPEHLAVTPPADAMVLRSYVDAVEEAFSTLGATELARYAASTDPPGVEIVDGLLVADEITAGNPRDW
jgi:hypothetical protein